MAIAPIDLQTIFAQVDKVGKTQMAQREGQVLHQAIQGTLLQKKTEENIQEVNEAQNTGEGAEKINDRLREKGQREQKSGRKEEEDPQQEDPQLTEEPIKASDLLDPALGRNIDISL
jgi:hypothetical protein